MRRAMIVAALTMSAMGVSAQADAAVTVTNTSGSPLANQIYGIAGTGTQVYGSSPNNDGIANVTFTADTNVVMGSGFAQINDATPNTPDWFTLVINPLQNFTDFKFSTQLTGNGTITVYYLLTGSGFDANDFSKYTPVPSGSGGSYSADNSNLNKLLSGGTFDGLAIRSSSPIAFFEVKQLSYNGVSPVPEPATWGLMLLGFGGIALAFRRNRRRGKRLLMQIA